MRFLLPVLCLALMAALPTAAAARPDGGGGWHGDGGGGRGWDGGPGRGWRDDRGGGGRGWRDGGGYGWRGGDGDGPPDNGRGRGRGQWGDDGDSRGNSLGRGWGPQQDEARDRVRSGEFRPLGSVLAGIRQRQPGRQLDAGIEEGPGGRPVYRVRWAADNGRRIDYIIDARTGAVIATEGQ